MALIQIIQRRTIPKISNIEIGLMIFFLWYYIIPSATSLNFMMVLGVALLYLFYGIQQVPVRYAKEVGKVLLCALIIAACYWLFTDTATIHKSVSMYQLKRYLSKFQQVAFGFFPIFLFARLMCAGTRQQKQMIAVTIAALLVYTLTQTWQELVTNQMAARSWANFAAMNEKNVGTYSFVYAISALIPVLMIMIFNTKDLGVKTLLSVAMTAIFTFLLYAQYTLSVLLAIVSIAVFIWMNSENTVLKTIFVLLIPFAFVALPPGLRLIANKVDSIQISIRLNELATALSGGDLGYNLGGRLELYSRAIQAFFRSPILGNRKLDFDGHATLFTILADVGLLGGIPYYYLYFSCKQRINTLLGDLKQCRQFAPVFIMFILLGATNPIHSAMPLYTVIWLLAPLVINLTNIDTVY